MKELILRKTYFFAKVNTILVLVLVLVMARFPDLPADISDRTSQCMFGCSWGDCNYNNNLLIGAITVPAHSQDGLGLLECLKCRWSRTYALTACRRLQMQLSWAQEEENQPTLTMTQHLQQISGYLRPKHLSFSCPGSKACIHMGFVFVVLSDPLLSGFPS